MKRYILLVMAIFAFCAAHSQKTNLRDSLKQLFRQDTLTRNYVDLLRDQALVQNDRSNNLHSRLDSLHHLKPDSLHKAALHREIFSTKKKFDYNQRQFDSTLVLLDSATGALNNALRKLEAFQKRHPHRYPK